MRRRFWIRALSLIWDLLPRNSQAIYIACQNYIDRFNGDNNSDMLTNGELRFLQQYVPDNAQVIFDVGANIGNWTSEVLKIKADVAVHCFEPSKITFEKLRARSFPSSVIYNNFGLSSVSGEATLYVFEDSAGINSLYQRRGLEAGWGLEPQSAAETITLATLDNYCEQKGIHEIDLLKLDVEGHELEVLRGAEQMLQHQRIRAIQFEYGGCNIDSGVLLKHIFELLNSFGYQLSKIQPNRLKPHSSYDQRLENFRYQNWVASPNSL